MESVFKIDVYKRQRQICQLREAGIDEVIVVTGYKAEMFEYLKEKLGVTLVHNPEYDRKNNHSSIYAVREYLHNTYICCADNYFNENPFEKKADGSFYSALYAEGETNESVSYTHLDVYKRQTQGGLCGML